MKRPDGVTVIAIYHFLLAIPSLVGACAILVFAIPAIVTETQGAMEMVWALFGVGLGLIATLGVGALSIVAGVGLLRLKEWARWLTISLAVLQLFLVPIGTIVGGLIIWFLLKDDVRQAFTSVVEPEAPAQE